MNEYRSIELRGLPRDTAPKKPFWLPVGEERWRIDWLRTNRRA